MATSTVPVFKRAFHDKLIGALPSVDVSYGWPDTSTPAEAVYIGDTELTQEWAAMARTTKPRAEDFTFEVFVEVAAENVDAMTVAERAWDLVAAVEDVLRNAADPQGSVTLGVAGVWQCEFRTATEELGFLRDSGGHVVGRACRITAEVRVRARIKL